MRSPSMASPRSPSPIPAPSPTATFCSTRANRKTRLGHSLQRRWHPHQPGDRNHLWRRSRRVHRWRRHQHHHQLWRHQRAEGPGDRVRPEQRRHDRQFRNDQQRQRHLSYPDRRAASGSIRRAPSPSTIMLARRSGRDPDLHPMPSLSCRAIISSTMTGLIEAHRLGYPGHRRKRPDHQSRHHLVAVPERRSASKAATIFSSSTQARSSTASRRARAPTITCDYRARASKTAR